MTKTGVDS